MNSSIEEIIRVRALRATQGSHTVYMLFLPGRDVLRIADIARLERDSKAGLQGFQRKEVREHVNEIAAYLEKGEVLFPNAIILALSPDTKFKQSRGTTPDVSTDSADAGQLEIPVRLEGARVAWIVDGQQRSLALSKVKDSTLIVPVVAFECESLDIQRQQFILVNRARPLSRRLVDELLPDTTPHLLPKGLKLRTLPSSLCNSLNTHTDSPFAGLIHRSSHNGSGKQAVVTDTAISNMIKKSLNNPNGALAAFAEPGQETGDATKMAEFLKAYWWAVRDTWPEAWGKKPEQSRLMHSAGIAAMGDLMDRISARCDANGDARKMFRAELGRISNKCAWTRGSWPEIERPWDDIESTTKDIKMLSQLLVQLYAKAIRV